MFFGIPIRRTRSVADTAIDRLVIERPGRARVFERFGIRYCCRGSETLGEACAGEELDLRAVLRELEVCDAEIEVEDRTDWSKAPMTELADHIVKDRYGYLKDALSRLEFLVEEVANAHGDRRPELVELRRIFGSLKLDLQEHHLEEEEVLFPMCRELDAAKIRPDFYWRTVENPIRMMVAEHQAAIRTLARMRELTRGFEPPRDACDAYRAMLDSLARLEGNLHLHIHEENNILFPKALAVEAALPKR